MKNPGPSPSAHLKTSLAALRDELTVGLIERDTPIRLALLAALAGEHLLLIGPPGTAKSELARRLRLAFRDSTYFERLLTRFSVPEELFGPLSIKGLEEDRYERLTVGYLPTAAVAFLDEIFKANSAILNSLLTLLNEREFDNGQQRVRTPLVCVVGASNELPEGEEMAALYDRFLLRCHVPPVSDSGFDALLALRGLARPLPAPSLQLSATDLELLRREAERVELREDVHGLLRAFRAFLLEQKIPVSDRRWRKIVFLLQMSAYSDGRGQVSLWDCWLLQHCAWEKPEQRDAIFAWYSARVGADAPQDPERFSRLVASLEKLAERERFSRTQAQAEDGALLYRDIDGKLTTEPKGMAQEVDEQGEPLFIEPNSYSGRVLTRAQLESRLGRFDTTDRRFWKLAEGRPLKPHMEPTRYSEGHVQARVGSIEDLQRDLEAFTRALEGHVRSLTEAVDGHLWISPGFSAVARAHLDASLERVAALAKTLTVLRKAFEELPRQ